VTRPTCDTPCCERQGEPGLWGGDECGCACHAPEGYKPQAPAPPAPPLTDEQIKEITTRALRGAIKLPPVKDWRCPRCGKPGVLQGGEDHQCSGGSA
jgi:hypothetical protein